MNAKYELNNIGDDTYLIYSEGHHDLEDWTKYVKNEYSSWGNFFDIAYHHYYRRVGNQYGTWYEPCFPFTRGAFKVTVAQEGWSDHTSFLKDKVQDGMFVRSIGNYHILKHRYMKDCYEVWYDTENFAATEIKSCGSLDDAVYYINKQIELGRC